jgi:hypothetical protein
LTTENQVGNAILSLAFILLKLRELSPAVRSKKQLQLLNAISVKGKKPLTG